MPILSITFEILHLVRKSRMVDLSLHSLIRLHDIVLSYVTKYRDIFTCIFPILLLDLPTASVWTPPPTIQIKKIYGLDDRGVGVRVPVGSRILSSPDGPDRL
jgi:hypothetical protein